MERITTERLERMERTDITVTLAEVSSMASELLELRRAVELSGVARLSPSSLPSVLYRPRLSRDGNAWCALYGEDLQLGVAGFGKSPAEAMAAFDAAWVREVQP